MANYPRFLTLADSTVTTESGVQNVRATNGTLRTRRLFAADKASFKIGHLFSPAELAELLAFYAANKDLDVTYPWPGTGEVFTVRFEGKPQVQPRGTWFEARVALNEV
jgi:hypothetical protein